jgi:predicted metal-binding membrane protein
MNRLQKIIILSLISTSGIAWLLSAGQQDTMMDAMTTYNPVSISLFTASWTAGMAAMMFPTITPMVLLYNTFVTNKENEGTSITIQEESRPKSSSIRSLRVILFIGCYLLVWALTGIALLLGWSVIMNYTIMTSGNSQLLPSIYGALLIIAGAYQFTPLKKMCIGYCESPMSFFMRRWKDGTLGAVRMGLWHGMYCLGCCWAYFLLMVALGWMNLLWMGLFAGIIFGEKMWKKGIWVARVAGVGLVITGILVISGMLPSLVSSASSMNDSGDMSTNDAKMSSGSDMSMTNDSTGKGSMSLKDSSNSATSSGSNDMMSDDDNAGKNTQGMSNMESSESQEIPDMNMQ